MARRGEGVSRDRSEVALSLITPSLTTPVAPGKSRIKFFNRRAQFEKKVDDVKWKACTVAFLHILSRFSGICALTWASAVLLGGFASSLTTVNFFLISAIILIEAIRLFIIHTITSSLSREQFRESSNPDEHHFTDTQKTRANQLDLICHVLSFFISFVSLVFVVVWFFKWSDKLHDTAEDASPAAAGTQDANRVNLPRALYIFYSLVLLNSGTSLLSTVLRFIFRRTCDAPSQNCLMCYHDEVFRTAIAVGLADGDRLELLEFAFVKLASDFRRNIRPQIIKRDNKDLISYLYDNPQGIAMVCEALKSSTDVWQQVVATNLPGFWVDEGRIHLQLAMFWALGERMHGAGKDAEGALNSIGHLARSFARREDEWPHPFLLEDSAIEAGRYCIVRRLVRLVCKRVRPTLLFQIRALDACCESPQVLKYLCRSRSLIDGNVTGHDMQDVTGEGGETSEGEDSEDLRMLCSALERGLPRAGTGVAAIYAVRLLLKLLPLSKEGLTPQKKKNLQAHVLIFMKAAEQKPYMWDNEVEMVQQLITDLDITQRPDWGKVVVRSTVDGDVIRHSNHGQ